MARFNEILAGRYNRFLQKLFVMKGGPPVPQLSGDVQAAIPLFSGQENRYLESWQQFGFAISTLAPLAGNRAAWRLRNPSGSNVVVVVEKLVIFEPTTADPPVLFYNSIASVLPTENQSNLTGTNMDSRGQQTGSTAIISTSINFGILGSGSVWQANIANNGFADLILYDAHEIVLPPGSQITIASNGVGVAQTILVSAWWRERFLEESERT